MKLTAGDARQTTAKRARTSLSSRMVGAAIVVFLCVGTFGQVSARPGEQSLKLFNINTKERATIVYRRNGRYDQAGLRKINAFLRDWRSDEPTRMDPALLDLVWDVYRRSGSRDYIHVVSGYRSATTNGKLRRRSKGVAKNSLHTKGRAMDFYLPDVKLSKLRELGLKLHFGGVGYYPRSGAPFVHLDTGRVRHWPRMSRQQLATLFPDGKTMHVPSDGKPLSGYAIVKADSDARKAGRRTAIASLPTPMVERRVARLVEAAPAKVDGGDPLVIASAPAEFPPTKHQVAVAIASYDNAPAPLPRLAPRRARIAAAPATRAAPKPAPALIVASATLPPTRMEPAFDFGTSQDWTGPAVPANLAAAMAERDQSRRGASLPIPPTSVVAIIEINRSLRAQEITAAVLRKGVRQVQPRVLSYAPTPGFNRQQQPVIRTGSVSGVPSPRASPLRSIAANDALTRSVIPAQKFRASQLTLTTLDTHGLKSWTGPGSTRQRAFAMLTMPDLRRGHGLTDVPEFGYAIGFSKRAYPHLRTDRFTGPMGRPPAIVMLVSR